MSNNANGGSEGWLSKTSTIIGLIASIVTILAFCGISSASGFLGLAPREPSGNSISATNAPLPAATSAPLPATIAAPVATSQPVQAAITPVGVSNDPTIESSRTFEVNQNIQTSVDGFEFVIKSIDLVQSNSMVWKIEIWNKTSQDQRIGISSRASYIVDNLGNRYPMTSSLNETVQPGTRSEISITFDPPKAGANVFSLYLLSLSRSFITFPEPAFIYSGTLVAEQALQPTPTDNASTLTINKQLQTSIANFEATLLSVEFLPTGSMRWNFEFWNKTSKDQRVFISARDSYIVDDLGNRYQIASTYDETLSSGVRVEASITTDVIDLNAKEFSFYMLSISSSFVNFQEPAVTINK